MKRVLFLLGLSITFSAEAQTNIGGVINTNTLLSISNSPYIVTNNLLVAQNTTVSVDPGVIFKFNEGIYLQVDGEFRALGTSGNPILFTKNTGASGWAGVRFKSTSTAYNSISGNGCILDHCILDYGKDYGNNERVIDAVYCSPRISNCEILNFSATGINIYGSSSQIINNKIHDGTGFPVWIWGYNPQWVTFNANEVYNTSQLTILCATVSNNYIHNINSDPALRIGDVASLTNNWFVDNLSAVGFFGGDKQLISCNTFSNNVTNIIITCARTPTIQNNNFFNYSNYNFYCSNTYAFYSNWSCPLPPGSGTSYSVDISGNFFNGISSTQLNNSIWDFNDDFNVRLKLPFTSTLTNSVNCGFLLGENGVNSKPDEFVLFPNPVSDILKLNYQGLNTSQVSVFNVIGEEVAKYEQGVSEFDLSDLAQGIYFIKIRIGDKIETRKIIKQ
jgi:hypothetical protein